MTYAGFAVGKEVTITIDAVGIEKRYLRADDRGVRGVRRPVPVTPGPA